ncbi:hypothetical protein M3Y97_00875400 [Aphelenchoides bicaudatus]|nr:hypothetical protein M3Y97_00875400 [Aphelenchoides bicaudatus]
MRDDDEEIEPLIGPGTSQQYDPEMAVVSNSFNNDVPKDEEIKPDDEMIEYLVDVPPEIEERGFTLRKFCAFVGPGFLMSIAYLDPGNIESDLQSGAVAQYKLLWVLLVSHIVGFCLQTLSARLGVVSGKNMAEVAAEFYPKVPRFLLWVCIEIAIIGSDMQEVIGTSVAIYMLSRGAIPLTVGVLITILDTLTFLFIEKFGFRKLEGFFAFLIAVMAIAFGFEFFTVKPDAVELLKGVFVPWCSGCGRKEFLQGISVVGAVIMPHNLYLHSALVKTRNIDRKKKSHINEANTFYFFDSAIALFCSFIINLFVVGVFAHGLFNKTNADVYNTCLGKPMFDPVLFPNNTDIVEADLYKGGIFLGCEFGMAALVIWGIGILASGQSSTMTGTYAGQFVMGGFLEIKWARWKRVFVTRLIAIVPTLVTVLFANGVYSLTGMNDMLNCLQMIILPFALIPIISFTSSREIMFDYRNSRRLQLLAIFVAIAVISIDLYFAFDFILSTFGSKWYVFLGLALSVSIYVSFVCYLLLVCLISMNICVANFIQTPWLKPNFNNLSIEPTWQKNGQRQQQYGTVTS